MMTAHELDGYCMDVADDHRVYVIEDCGASRAKAFSIGRHVDQVSTAVISPAAAL